MQPLIELKTRPRVCPVSLSLSMPNLALFLDENVFLSEIAEVGATSSGQGLELRDLLGLESLVSHVDDERQDGVNLREELFFDPSDQIFQKEELAF